MGHSMVIGGAQVVDPLSNTIQRRDLYIQDGKVSAVPPKEDAPVFNASDCYVAPGFVDGHVHVFGAAAISVPADRVGIQQGVTTVVDAGSTGLRDFPRFETEVIGANKTDVRFFLNIARNGLCEGLSELADMDGLMREEELDAFQKEHGERLVGLKVRMSGSVVQGNGLEPLVYARKLADASGLPLLVHVGNAPPPLDRVLNLLQKGDIVTHFFHGKSGGVSDYPEAYKSAVQRGVHFDVGHGAASFSYKTAPKVLQLCPVDFTISTDVYDKNYNGPVYSLMETMSKFLPMGFALEDVVRRVTSLPRQILGLPEAGVNPGDTADLTIFRLGKPAHALVDSEGVTIDAKQVLQPVASIKNGERVWGNE